MEKRAGVATLHKAGLSTRKIAAQLNLAQSSVFRIIKLFKETESVLNRPYKSLNRRQGRTAKTRTNQKLGNNVPTSSQKRTATWKSVVTQKREQILQMAAMGQSMRRIATLTMVNASTASRIIRSGVEKTSKIRLGRHRNQRTGSKPSKRTPSMTRSSFGSRRKQSSIEQRAAIMALYNEGLSTRLIAKRLYVSQSMVVRCVKRFKETRSHEVRTRCGRPRIITRREDKYVTILSKRERTRTAPDIREELNSIRSTPLSVPTVRRRLLEVGLKSRIAVKKKPLLKEDNIVKRLQWAKEHESWCTDQWSRVLFTDESKFDLFSNKRRVFVRRLQGERMNPGCIVPTVKHGGGSVLVWGSFARSGVGDLIRIDGILNKEGYLNILQQHAVPNGKRLVGRGFILQQDNDPKHSSKLCRGYVNEEEQKGELVNMVWPAQSPDLNPIELLWDELDRATRKMRPHNHTHLWECLQRCWQEINDDTLRKLIERMSKVCKAVINAKGVYFEESKV